ncbi:(Fe-S)-binding protein [Thermosulfurimonas marina]|uniref:(Fe-S)-binding protein n=1 Tax=Thermosulfurimonas marina TaxID=2047767 RepID=A0A6H1WQ97_9BACT|nr:(Fe-S)-binding protein [Thermosulfurimonas marina]QJA05372.1 (Fe-S)-binding protein [Thermosulfurimonas marina]
MKKPELSLCSRCGRCLSVCPTYLETRLERFSPRGRVALLEAGLPDRKSLKRCLRCGRCERICPNEVPLARTVALEEKGFPLLGKLLSFLSLPSPSRFFPRPGDPVLFLSCGAAFLYPEALARYQTFLEGRGFSPGISPALCCGLPYLSLGGLETFFFRARKTLEALKDIPGPLVTLCASCFWTLKKLYPLLFADTELEETAEKLSQRVTEAWQFVSDNRPLLRGPSAGALHLPCHMEEPLAVPDLPQISACCGAASPEELLRAELPRPFRKALAEIRPLTLATACTGCYLKLKRALKAPPEIRHWAEFLGV